MRGLAGAEKRIDIPRTGKAFAISFLQPAPGKMMAQSFQILGGADVAPRCFFPHRGSLFELEPLDENFGAELGIFRDTFRETVDLTGFW
jgi:hypothetical protein